MLILPKSGKKVSSKGKVYKNYPEVIGVHFLMHAWKMFGKISSGVFASLSRRQILIYLQDNKIFIMSFIENLGCMLIKFISCKSKCRTAACFICCCNKISIRHSSGLFRLRICQRQSLLNADSWCGRPSCLNLCYCYCHYRNNAAHMAGTELPAGYPQGAQVKVHWHLNICE